MHPPQGARRRSGPGCAAWVALTGVLLVFAVWGAYAGGGPLLTRFAGDVASQLDDQSASSSDTPALDVAAPPGARAIPTPGQVPPGLHDLDVAAVTASVRPATVSLEGSSRYQSGGSGGTGMVLTASGLVLTDEHVIAGTDGLTARVGGTGRLYDVALIGVDVAEDVALLQVERASGLSTVVLGDSSSAALGERVAVLGYHSRRRATVYDGTLTDLDEPVDVSRPSVDEDSSSEPKTHYSGMLHADAASQPGMSGGPVIDGTGRVIGMLQVGSDEDSFSIPIDRALAAAREIAAGHATADVLVGAPAELGVVSRGRTTGANAGARVAKVEPGTPAEGAGIVEGDIIASVDARPIASPAELRQVLTGYRPGDRVTVVWLDRTETRHSIRLTLGSGPAP